ncbi:hypothetical protein [Rhizobium sp. 007]|uniref:hypothetical protein n=1 Tax=Rhizobium sp. 007 TaxID=2785056 RepID=UPI0018909D8E|nr:hypothetical protein [Rhizobium sp. 007]QPB21095.1 hypothetical protein ISN39_06370 [Rhizobium sp. 007]
MISNLLFVAAAVTLSVVLWLMLPAIGSRYVHPPSLSPDEIAAGYLRHIPTGSKITGSRKKWSVNDKTAIAA